MRMRILLSMTLVVIISMAIVAPASAGCNPYGVSTMRGDAQYPAGWASGYGAIEITPPDEFVYGVTDGAIVPQQFISIKAKLRNRIEKQIGAGTLKAAARYRKRIGYQPDLSSDPPNAESIEANFSASLSAIVPIDGLASDASQTIAFDFSEDPIPAGITDLYLIVVFQGEIEGMQNPATTVGIKDLNEPTHITIWNNRDYFDFWGQLRTTESIISNPTELDTLVDECPWHSDLSNGLDYLTQTRVLIGFSAEVTETPILVVEYNNLSPGHYGRVLVLLDVGLTGSYYMYRQNYYLNGCTIGNSDEYSSWEEAFWASCHPGRQLLQGAAVNQQGAHSFIAYDTITARQRIKTHLITGKTWYCPNDLSHQQFTERLNREAPPAGDDPATVTVVNFP